MLRDDPLRSLFYPTRGDRIQGAFIDAELRDHPQWVACREVLEGRGRLESVREQALNILEAANEDPSGFRVTSRYVIAIARRMEQDGNPSR